LKLDISSSAAGRFGLHYLADHFLLALFVGEKDELARREWSGNADDSAVWKDEDGLRGFRKGNALVGAVDRPSTIHRDRDFEGNGLRTCRGIACRLGVRGGGCRSCA
jgi:hypothetical protein